MRGIRSDHCSRYTPVPQVAISDEDEGVYDESPENSQHVELLSSSGSSYNIQADIRRSSSILEEEEEEDLDCGAGVRSQNDLSRISSLPVRIGRPMMTPPSNEDVRMSCARTSCFLFSVFVCLAYVVSVLWLIPCQLVPCRSSSSSGNGSSSSFSVREWIVAHNRTRFTSRPQAVIVGRSGKTVVVLAYETRNDSYSNSTFTTSGVVGLRGENGKEAWKTQFYTNVIDVLCNKTDVNADTIRDCFVTGTSGLLAAMSAYNGETFWYLHNHNDNTMKILAVSSPCPLIDMDLDGDGTEDLAVVALIGTDDNSSSRVERTSMASVVESKVQMLLLVSGSTGQTIGRPVPFCCICVALFNAHNDSSSSVRLSNPVLYDFGNGSRALLVSSSKRTNKGIEGVVLLLPIVEVYEEAMKVSHSESSTQNSAESDNDSETSSCGYVTQIYSGIENVISMHVIYHNFERASDVLLYTNNGETLVFLNGTNAFHVDWTVRELGNTFSLPTFGFYDNDKVVDVFFTLTPSTCDPSKCNSKAVVLSGKNGQLLNEINTRCVAFGPNVVVNGNILLFETPGSNNETNTLTVSGFSYRNATQELGYSWSYVRSNSLNEEPVRQPIFDKKNAVFQDSVPLKSKATSQSDRSDGVQKGLEMPIRVLAFQNRVGTTPFQIATLDAERTECNASPTLFYSTVLEGENQAMLVTVQNKVTGTVVSVTDLKPSLPQENSSVAFAEENVEADQ